MKRHDKQCDGFGDRIMREGKKGRVCEKCGRFFQTLGMASHRARCNANLPMDEITHGGITHPVNLVHDHNGETTANAKSYYVEGEENELKRRNHATP